MLEYTRKVWDTSRREGVGYKYCIVEGRVEGCLNVSEKVWDTSRREGVGYKYCNGLQPDISTAPMTM